MKCVHAVTLHIMIDHIIILLVYILEALYNINIILVFSLQIPLSWYNLWEGPDEPTLYLRSLVAKALALRAWEEKGRAGTLLQEGALDLSELFYPNTFLNALRQQTAR